MKTVAYITVLIYSSMFALAAAEAKQATVKIHVYIMDEKGNSVEGATVEFISNNKDLFKSGRHPKNKKSTQISKTDTRGVIVVNCPGIIKAAGKDIPREVIFISGEFKITAPEFGIHKKPYRTVHLPQRENGSKSILKLMLKK